MSADGTAVYFAPLLPWQARAWAQTVGQFDQEKLPHGLLAAGMSGIGKRAFVWRLVARLLCHQPADGACGNCPSCQWLRVGTHPDLLALPSSALPDSADEPTSIKIDDIRALQDYSQTKGQTAKVIVIDQADSLGIAAANALLKTLEEPRAGVFLILISDHPSRILPTIRSRVQSLPLAHIEHDLAVAYLCQTGVSQEQAKVLLDLADGAVLAAKELPDQPWFQQRDLWLKTLVALRTKKRSPAAAAQYWQGVLPLTDFLYLSRVMLTDLYRVLMGLPSLHSDLSVVSYLPSLSFYQSQLDDLLAGLDETYTAITQNVQEKIAYARLMVVLSQD